MRKICQHFLVSISFLLITAPAFADHCWFAGEVRGAAHELDEAADHFHRLIHDIDGYSHVADQAHSLSDAAENLHEAAHVSASCREIRWAFRRTQRAYYRLARQFHHAHDIHHNDHVADDWRRVQYAFARVRRSLDRDEWRYNPINPYLLPSVTN